MSDQETVQLIALEKLQPFKNYPSIVRDDEQMKIITDSVRNVGILTPAIVRPYSRRKKILTVYIMTSILVPNNSKG